ncbi:MAG: DUF4398 domain-containing protein [Gammaproteobacteria bacterium]|nr:DUF4398 domain-containing protein [Gammaproteobacteria bacterium]MDH5803213.1 DUF4398 domain-containing protein [Gammaproteobacteria bacterium]
MAKRIGMGALLLLLAACAQAPVQEMSDARQAIQAAQTVLNGETQENLSKAKQLLFKAEEALQEGEYSEARDNAVAAKEQAMQAQQNAAQQPAN